MIRPQRYLFYLVLCNDPMGNICRDARSVRPSPSKPRRSNSWYKLDAVTFDTTDAFPLDTSRASLQIVTRLTLIRLLFDFFGALWGFLPWIFFISLGRTKKFFGLIVWFFRSFIWFLRGNPKYLRRNPEIVRWEFPNSSEEFLAALGGCWGPRSGSGVFYIICLGLIFLLP